MHLKTRTASSCLNVSNQSCCALRKNCQRFKLLSSKQVVPWFYPAHPKIKPFYTLGRLFSWYSTGYLEVKGSRPVLTLTFQACMLVLLRESYTFSWLNAKEIPIHQKHFSGNTSLTVHIPWQEKH